MAPQPRLLALSLLLGCGHSEPFTNPNTGTEQPFDPGPPVRLTANHGGDLQPAWTADGNALLYSVSDPARQDRDVCLALITAGGARQSERSDPNDGTEVLHLPYSRGTGLVNWAGRIHWVEGSRLAYLGQTRDEPRGRTARPRRRQPDLPPEPGLG
jgi:hypothetical protein